MTGTQNERCGSYVFMNCINYWDWTEIPSIVLGMEENLKYWSVLHLKRYYLDGFPFNRVFFAFQNTDNEVTFGPMKLKQKNLSVSNPLDYFWVGGGLEGDISGWILYEFFFLLLYCLFLIVTHGVSFDNKYCKTDVSKCILCTHLFISNFT